MNNGLCYHYAGDSVKLGFSGAKDYCATKNGGFPVTIKDEGELNAILKMIDLCKIFWLAF